MGGGHTLLSDLARVAEMGLQYDAVFACNDAGAEWAGPLEGWVTLHPEKLHKWVAKRQANGYEPARRLYAHRAHKAGQHMPEGIRATSFSFPGQKSAGSSGCFVAKVALVDCGFDQVVLCGIPMTQSPHFFDDKDWRSANGFRRQWFHIDRRYLHRMRSMSGWTRVLLGAPDDWKVK